MKKKYFCKEPNCNNEISYATWKYGKGRCHSCANHNRKGKFHWNVGIDNPMSGKNARKNPNYKHGKYCKNKKYYCIDCGDEIDWRAIRCGSCGAKERLKDSKKHPNWKGGKSFEPYSIEFTNELREHIRKRDKYTCQNCGMTEEEHLIVFGQVLSVHHIDYDKKNCKEENLISLCNQCNTKANFNRKYWEEYFKEVL